MADDNAVGGARLTVPAWSAATNPTTCLRTGDRIVLPSGLTEPVLGVQHSTERRDGALVAVTRAWVWRAGEAAAPGLSWVGESVGVEVERG